MDNQNVNLPDGSQDRCQEVLDLIPAYSLRATDPSETAFVEANLANCPDAIAELEAYRLLNEAMLYSAGPMVAPQSIESKLKVDSSWGKIVRRMTLARLAAVIALVLLGVSNLYWWQEVRQIKEREEATMQELDEQSTFLAALTTGATRQVTLNAADDSGAIAEVLWEPQTRKAILYARNFTPLSPEMAYQLWLVRDDERISLGVFQVSTSGIGTYIFTTDEDLDNFDAMGITPEPATGSSEPTAPPIVAGEL